MEDYFPFFFYFFFFKATTPEVKKESHSEKFLLYPVVSQTILPCNIGSTNLILNKFLRIERKKALCFRIFHQ